MISEILSRLRAKPENREKIPGADLWLLALLGVIFLLIQNTWFLNLPPDQGTIDEVNNSLRHFLAFTRHPFALSPMISEYQPLHYWVTCLFYLAGGFSVKLAYLSSGAWVFVLLFSLYGLGFRLGGRSAAWLAVLLSLGNPRTIFWSRLYCLNFSEMAMVALSFYLLLQTRGFTRKQPALWLGAALGFTFLTRYAIFYLLLPVLWVFYRLMLEALKEKKSALWQLLALALGGSLFLWGLERLYAGGGYLYLEKHFLIFQLLGLLGAGIIMAWESRSPEFKSPLSGFYLTFAVALLIALPWHLGDLGLQYDKIQRHLLHHEFLVPSHGGLLLDYLSTAAHIFPGILLFLLVGLAYALVNLKNLNLQLLLIALIPTVWLLHAGDPNYRYFLPLQIFWVLLAVVWTGLLPRGAKIILVALSALWFTLNLTGVAIVESNWGKNSPQLHQAALRAVDFSAYHHPLLTVLPSGSNDKGLKPVREPAGESENPLIVTLPEPVLKEIGRLVSAHAKIDPERELIIARYNRRQFFVLYKWQLESHLLAAGFIPEKTRQDFNPFRLTYFHPGNFSLRNPKPDFLIATLPAGGSFAELEELSRKHQIVLTRLADFRVNPGAPNPSPFPVRLYLVK